MPRWSHLALLILGWLSVTTSPAIAQAHSPLVLAAASLQESLDAAADAWAARGHPRPVISFAASSALARQITAGAPADLFISADEAWMDAVQKDGLIRPGTRRSFLSNQLVLIAAAGKGIPMPIRPGFPLARALGKRRLAMADPDAVPAGKYGKAALVKLGVWPSVADRIAVGESVRAALAMVERGQTPYGIVYATDARASTLVRVAGVFPATSHPPITYPVAVLKTATSPDAEAFRRFLLSAQAKAIFRRHGFMPR
ncbi:molybdate ABC transporter substrate-binding protein [soil metagenome]